MNNNQILVSIVMPVYNAREYLAYSLPAIKKSNYPHFELIVVDDNSTDGSLEFAKKYADTVIKMDTRVAPGKARNRGAYAGNGSILFFIDADIQVAPDTVSTIVKAMGESPEIEAFFGSYDEKPVFKDFFSQHKNLFHHFVHQNSNTEAGTFWAGCGAIRKDTFIGAGGFPETYSSPSIEDVELGYKLVEDGKKIKLLKELQVTHLKRWNLVTLLKSDIIHRAIPWTKLACKKGLPRDLNFKFSDRISGIIACLFFISIILAWRWNWLLFLPVIFAGIVFYLNRNLYKFFLQKRGFKFTILGILFHWFYLFYSSLVFAFFSIFFTFKKLFFKQEA